jgi:peptidoglycan DL-endopeptidase CwlO
MTMKKKWISVMLSCSLLAGTVSVFPTVTFAQTEQTARIINGVNFRNQPSLDGDNIRLLKTGETVTLLSKINAYWFKIKDSRGQVGFVTTSGKYVQVVQVNNTPPISETNSLVKSSVAFRTSPSTSSKITRYLKSGEAITVLEKVNVFWYKIKDSRGVLGYVSSNSKYVTYNGASQPSVPIARAAEKVISAGMKYLGTPYEYGSSRSNTNTFDCSDFVRQAYIDGIGLVLPADSRSQGDYVKKKGNIKTDWRELQPGDIMFFMEYKGSSASGYQGVDKLSERITHDGIYLGDGKILQTYSKDSGGVRIDSIEGTHWEKRFLFGGSPL